jgi:ferredoxin
MLPCDEGCEIGIQPRKIREKIDCARSILDAIGIESQRITSLDDMDDSQTLIDGVRSFAYRISHLEELASARVSVPPLERDGNLLKLTRRLAKEHHVDPEECLRDSSLPFWSLEIESDKCHFCGLCSICCPTDAISLRQDDASIQLLFSYERCVACGLCPQKCPTGAIKVEKVLNLGGSATPFRVLKEERLSRCENCGAPITPIRVDDLGSMEGLSEEYLSLISKRCPRCRLGSFLATEAPLHRESS